jgi:uncharacterized Tic20 family protein
MLRNVITEHGERAMDQQNQAGPPEQGPPSQQPPPGYQQPPGVPPPDAKRQKDERTYGMLCHLLALAGFVVPFGNIIGPLIIWLMKKDEFPFVNDQGKQSLNFQISMMIYAIISAVLTLVIIGLFLLIAVGITNLVLVIIASMRANEGQAYRYPLAIQFIK